MVLRQWFTHWPEQWHQFQAQWAWAAHTPVCQRCRNRLPDPTLPLTHCPRCLDWAGFEVTFAQPAIMTQGGWEQTDGSPLIQTLAVWQWTTSRYHHLLGYKSRPNQRLTPFLVDLILQGWLSTLPSSSVTASAGQSSVVLMPMPRHQPDLPNHLMPLARAVCARMGWALWPQGLERVIPLVSAQKHLSARQRRYNLAGSLKASGPSGTENLGVKQVVILDDIRTTGASLQEAQRAVWQAFPQASITGITLLQVPASTG
jgi:predicted amidophosphoribosyltransferase